MENLEEEISDLERLSVDSELDELGATPKPAPPKKFSLRDMASSVMSKLTGHLQVKTTLSSDQVLRLPLVEKSAVTRDTVLLRFGLPSSQHVLGLPVGNYILLQAWVNGEMLVRPYTPIRDSTGGRVELLVKVYPEGKMSRYLDSLKIGESIEGRGPFGRIQYNGRGTFVIDGEQRTYSNVGLICGGSGLTPAYRVLRAALEDPADRTQFRLLYANRTPQDILLRDELDAWARDHPDRFQVWYTVDEPAPPGAAAAAAEWGGEVGYVTPAMVRAFTPPPGPGAAVFMCGPPIMLYTWARPAVLAAGHAPRDCLEF